MWWNWRLSSNFPNYDSHYWSASWSFLKVSYGCQPDSYEPLATACSQAAKSQHRSLHRPKNKHMWSSSLKVNVCLFCERSTCSAHYQPCAPAGTYVTSFLILLMWKEEAPLLSPDLLITAALQERQCNFRAGQTWLFLTTEQLTKSNVFPDSCHMAHMHARWCFVRGMLLCCSACLQTHWTGCRGLFCVSPLAGIHSTHQAFLSCTVWVKVLKTVWNMQRRCGALHSLMPVCIYEGIAPLCCLTHYCPHKNKWTAWKKQ